MSDDDPRRFAFVQLEFPWRLGPPEGRYVLREGHEGTPDEVLVIGVEDAPRGRRRSAARRRTRRVEPDAEPAPVPVTRATLIDAAALPDTEAAERWLRSTRDKVAEGWADRTVASLNRVLHAHRCAVADATVRDVRREQALATRLGYGTGKQVAEGAWSAAVELPPPRARTQRTAVLRPQERLAAILGGRERTLVCETLAQRARLDLNGDREREAALQLRVALDAALAELAGDRALAERVAELGTLRDAVASAAAEALGGRLDREQTDAVAHALGRLEAALRARAAART